MSGVARRSGMQMQLQGLKPELILEALRGAEAPLFHETTLQRDDLVTDVLKEDALPADGMD